MRRPLPLAALLSLCLCVLLSPLATASSSSPLPRLGGQHKAQVDPPQSVFLPPVLADGSLLLDRDNGTRVYEDTLEYGTVGGGYQGGPMEHTYSFSMNPRTQFAVLTLNHTSGLVRMRPTVVGGEVLPGALRNPKDIEQRYLLEGSELGSDWNPAEHPYSTLQFKPSEMSKRGVCPPAGLCTINVVLVLSGSGTPASPVIPFRLSVLVGDMLPFRSDSFFGVQTGRVRTLGVEVTADDTDVLIQSLAVGPHGAAAGMPLVTDTPLAVYNAANPLQYWYPHADSAPHRFGAEMDSMIVGSFFDLPSSGQIRPPLKDSINLPPTVGGHPYADPYVRTGQLVPSLYLIVLYPSENSQPQNYPINAPGISDGGRTQDVANTHYFEVLVTPNFEVVSSSFGVSMFGIVGALTVLLLCVCSGMFVVLRRRIAMQSAAAAGGDEALAMQIMVRRARLEAGLPQYDEQGRPIRYDAQGRVLPDLGAKKEQIEALPSRAFVAGCMPTEDATCTICLGEYNEGELLRALPCGHEFQSDAHSVHNSAECIGKWLLHKRHCVLCQQDIEHATNVKAHHADVVRNEMQPMVDVEMGRAEGGDSAPRNTHTSQEQGEEGASPRAAREAVAAAISDTSSDTRQGKADRSRSSVMAVAGAGAGSVVSGSSPRSVSSSARPPVTLHGFSPSPLFVASGGERTVTPGCVNESKEDVEREARAEERAAQSHRPSHSGSISAARRPPHAEEGSISARQTGGVHVQVQHGRISPERDS